MTFGMMPNKFTNTHTPTINHHLFTKIKNFKNICKILKRSSILTEPL